MTRAVGIVLFSVVEVEGLAVWLTLADAGFGAVGLGVLFVALSLEHIITDNELRGRFILNLSDLPFVSILLFSAIETLIWGAWLLVSTAAGHGTGIAFLFAALLIEHTISKNVHERDGIFSEVVDLSTVPHTAVESIAGQGWLVLVRAGQPVAGVVLLFAGSVIEHTIAVLGTDT